jgi:hypothetical protein
MWCKNSFTSFMSPAEICFIESVSQTSMHIPTGHNGYLSSPIRLALPWENQRRLCFLARFSGPDSIVNDAICPWPTITQPTNCAILCLNTRAANAHEPTPGENNDDDDDDDDDENSMNGNGKAIRRVERLIRSTPSQV